MPPTQFRLAPKIAFFAALAAIFSGCSAESRKTGHLNKADKYFTAGEYEKAEIEYKNVLQLGGTNPQAVGRLGIIYFEQGRLARATSYLRKAHELEPKNLEVRLKLGYLLLATGKSNEARDAALYILDQNPQDREAPILLAETAIQPKDAAEDRARLQKLATAETAPVLTALALLDLRERKFQEAEAVLNRAQKVDPKYPYVPATFGRLYWIQKNPAAAEKAFVAAVDGSPRRSPIRLQAVQFYLQTGKLDAAKQMLEDMRRNTPDFLPSYILLANIAASEKRFDDSIALLDQVVAREPFHGEALLLAAQVRMAKGEREKAQAILENAVAKFPDVPQIHLQLGNVHLAGGDLAAATSSFSEALKLAPDFAPANLALAQTNIRQRNFAAAVTSLLAFLQKNPGSNEAQFILAEAYRNQGNLDGALALYRKLEEAAPDNSQVKFLTASVLIQQNKKSEARTTLIKATELAPDFLPALELLVNLDVADRQFAAAEARLQAELLRNPKNAGTHLILARVYLAQSQNQKAETALQQTIKLQPDSPIAYLLLAQLYLNTNQFDNALPNLQAAVEKNPKDVKSLVLIGVLQEQKKNFAAARVGYEKALAIDPNLVTALNNLAYLLSEHFGELDKALELAQRARERAPNQAESTDTMGWLLYRKGQYARATTLLEESAEKLGDNAEAQFHMGMAYYMMGNEDGARRLLERALEVNKGTAVVEEAREYLSVLSLDAAKDGGNARAIIDKALDRRKDDPIALSKLAALYEREGNNDKALGTYEMVLKGNPSNATAAVNAIRLYRLRNDTAKALELAKATRKVVPGDARIAHAVGRLAYESGERLWSVGVLQEAARRQTGDAEVFFDLGEASYSIGQLDAAEAAFRQALEVKPEFSRASKTRQYLELMRAAQNPTDAAAALKSIELALTSDPSYVPALIARGVIDEHKGDVKSAKQSYEKALARFPEFTPAKKRLAILYSAHPAEDEKKAYEIASKAREAFPNDSEVAKAFGIILYQQKNYTRAATLLQESARSRPDDAEVMYYLGMSQRQLKDQAASTRALQRALDLGLSGSLATEARKSLLPAGK
jgi:tetratricopeptide (TPR) repeat protein